MAIIRLQCCHFLTVFPNYLLHCQLIQTMKLLTTSGYARGMTFQQFDVNSTMWHNNHMHRSGRRVRLLKSTSLAATR